MARVYSPRIDELLKEWRIRGGGETGLAELVYEAGLADGRAEMAGDFCPRCGKRLAEVMGETWCEDCDHPEQGNH